jgi:hypothetical protein
VAGAALRDANEETRRRAPIIGSLECIFFSELFLRSAVNGRWARHALDRILLKKLHRLGDGALGLRVVALDHIRGRVFYIDVGANSFIFDRPFSREVVKCGAGWKLIQTISGGVGPRSRASIG